MDESPAKTAWIHAAVERHGAALTRYATSITGSAESARDVVQDTFLRLCDQDPAGLDGHLAEWLFTVCRNRALDMQRKTHRWNTVPTDALETMPAPEVTPALAAERADTLRAALDRLASLPFRQQEIVRLKFQGGLSYAEISRVTGLSVSNVGFILHTALKTLRQQLHWVSASPDSPLSHE